MAAQRERESESKNHNIGSCREIQLYFPESMLWENVMRCFQFTQRSV